MFVDVFLYPRWLQVIVQSTGISEDTEIHLLKTLIRHNDTIISNKDPGSYSQYISNRFLWMAHVNMMGELEGVQWTRWLQPFPNSVESSFQSMLEDSWLVVAPPCVVESAGQRGGFSSSDEAKKISSSGEGAPEQPTFAARLWLQLTKWRPCHSGSSVETGGFMQAASHGGLNVFNGFASIHRWVEGYILTGKLGNETWGLCNGTVAFQTTNQAQSILTLGWFQGAKEIGYLNHWRWV